MSAPTSTVGRWLSAARPKTLPLAVAPVLAGIALAVAETGRVLPVTALVTVLTAVAIQVGTNLHNDAGDFERGTDAAGRLGPARATAEGWFTARQVRFAAHLVFLGAFLLGLWLALRGGWPILALGVASLISGYAYTSGARPIAYGPWGELFVLVFFGLAAVWGSHYLQTLSFSPATLWIGAALGLPAAAVLLLNNYRDLASDRAAGRRTLCHYLDRAGARRLYAVLLLLPFPLVFLAPLPARPWPVLGALPFALALILRLFRGSEGAALNPMLAATAGFQLVFVVLLVVGFAVGPKA